MSHFSEQSLILVAIKSTEKASYSKYNLKSKMTIKEMIKHQGSKCLN